MVRRSTDSDTGVGWFIRLLLPLVGFRGLPVTQNAIQVVFSPVYLSRACSDRSRPNPDCLKPPNGVCALSASTVLTDTVPARSAAATRCARERSFVHTEAASP